ncbi:hypothetical protein EF384_04685 [Aerococcus agrisoli]|uniref:Uncharacterized protein n=1 Tax=Aerococcus agrisoli TaxID=2487350 RepID=A0A3N4GEL6_9LACT|nr:hypothetical protein EF384_04685 [Aerococcus agrisoli]
MRYFKFGIHNSSVLIIILSIVNLINFVFFDNFHFVEFILTVIICSITGFTFFIYKLDALSVLFKYLIQTAISLVLSFFSIFLVSYLSSTEINEMPFLDLVGSLVVNNFVCTQILLMVEAHAPKIKNYIYHLWHKIRNV